jgi:hypothetical protein
MTCHGTRQAKRVAILVRVFSIAARRSVSIAFDFVDKQNPTALENGHGKSAVIDHEA